MLIAFAVYSALFFLLFVAGRWVQIRDFRHDLLLKGRWPMTREVIATLCSVLLFVAAWGLVTGTPLLRRWFWVAYLAVSVGSLLMSTRYIRGLQAEYGCREGLHKYLINTAMVLPMDLGVFVYAFMSPEIWSDA